MPRDSHWRINDTPIDGHTGPESSHEYGGGYSLEIWLSDKSDSPAGVWPDAFERYRTLLRYQKYAGEFALHDLVGGRVAFTETHAVSSSIPNGTLLVALRPPAGQRCGRGMWALVASVTDNTIVPDTLCRLEMELVFVAPLDDYPDHAAVRADLEAPI